MLTSGFQILIHRGAHNTNIHIYTRMFIIFIFKEKENLASLVHLGKEALRF